MNKEYNSSILIHLVNIKTYRYEGYSGFYLVRWLLEVILEYFLPWLFAPLLHYRIFSTTASILYTGEHRQSRSRCNSLTKKVPSFRNQKGSFDIAELMLRAEMPAVGHIVTKSMPTACSCKSNLLSAWKKTRCCTVLLTAIGVFRREKRASRRACSSVSTSPWDGFPVVAFGSFYKATLVRLRLWASENSGLYPTRGENKPKELRNNDTMLQRKIMDRGRPLSDSCCTAARTEAQL